MPNGTASENFWGSKVGQLTPPTPTGSNPAQTAALQRMQQIMMQQRVGQTGGQFGGATSITTPSTLPPSPEVMGAIGDMRGYLEGLQQQNPWQEAYNAIQGIIGQAGEQYGSAATRQARTAQQTGISTGFNPLEAQQAGQEAQRQTLQQYFALLPALQAQASQFPIQQQQFMGGLAPLYGQIAQILGMSQQPGPTVSTQFNAQAGQQAQPSLVEQMMAQLAALRERPSVRDQALQAAVGLKREGPVVAPATETIPGLYGLGGGRTDVSQMGLAQMLGIAPSTQQQASQKAAELQGGKKEGTTGKKQEATPGTFAEYV